MYPMTGVTISCKRFGPHGKSAYKKLAIKISYYLSGQSISWKVHWHLKSNFDSLTPTVSWKYILIVSTYLPNQLWTIGYYRKKMPFPDEFHWPLTFQRSGHKCNNFILVSWLYPSSSSFIKILFLQCHFLIPTYRKLQTHKHTMKQEYLWHPLNHKISFDISCKSNFEMGLMFPPHPYSVGNFRIST